MAKITRQVALDYHSKGKPGKLEVIPTTSYSTQTDLSLAYTPGVAEPCREIEANPEEAYKYTMKGNLVLVILAPWQVNLLWKGKDYCLKFSLTWMFLI